MTGLVAFSTSASKVASVTALVVPTSRTSFHEFAQALNGLWLSSSGWAASAFVVGQPALRVDGRRTAGARSGNGLPVGPVDDITGREHAFDGSARVGMLDEQVAVRVSCQLALEKLASGV